MLQLVYIALFSLQSAFAIPVHPNSETELYKVLKEQDSILFHAAFNTCNEKVMSGMFTEDFEFYHDRSGITEGKASFLEGFMENCASRVPGKPQPSKRILIPNSLKVYPMKNNGVLYGAIQIGMHEFEFLDQNGVYQKGDIARFTHVWVLEDGAWKIRRELSYDHQSRTGQSSP